MSSIPIGGGLMEQAGRQSVEERYWGSETDVYLQNHVCVDCGENTALGTLTAFVAAIKCIIWWMFFWIRFSFRWLILDFMSGPLLCMAWLRFDGMWPKISQIPENGRLELSELYSLSSSIYWLLKCKCNLWSFAKENDNEVTGYQINVADGFGEGGRKIQRCRAVHYWPLTDDIHFRDSI